MKKRMLKLAACLAVLVALVVGSRWNEDAISDLPAYAACLLGDRDTEECRRLGAYVPGSEQLTSGTGRFVSDSLSLLDRMAKEVRDLSAEALEPVRGWVLWVVDDVRSRLGI